MTRAARVRALGRCALCRCVRRLRLRPPPSADPERHRRRRRERRPTTSIRGSARDDVSQKRAQLIFNGLMTLDEHLRVVPELAERLDNPEPTDVRRHAAARRPVSRRPRADLGRRRLHVPQPARARRSSSPHKGAFRMLQVGRRARSLHRRLHAEGAVRLVPGQPRHAADRAGRRRPLVPRASDRHRARIGSSATPSTIISSWRRSTTTSAAAPRNDGVVLKVVPDNIMARPRAPQRHDRHRRQRPRRRTSSHQLERDAGLQTTQSPGVDYQYIGFNMRDPVLKDVRVRQAHRLRHRPPGHHRLPAPRPGDSRGRHPAADVVGVRSRCVHVHVRSGAGPRAARRGRLSRS